MRKSTSKNNTKKVAENRISETHGIKNISDKENKIEYGKKIGVEI